MSLKNSQHCHLFRQIEAVRFGFVHTLWWVRTGNIHAVLNTCRN